MSDDLPHADGLRRTPPPAPECGCDYCCNAEPIGDLPFVDEPLTAPEQGADHPSEVERLRAALAVYDVTLWIAVHWLKSLPFHLASQIAAAREACLWATGDESLIAHEMLRPTEESSHAKETK